MRLPFRVGIPAVASLLVNGAMLAALFTLGMAQGDRPVTRREPTVMALAVLKGADDGAEQATSATAPAAAPATPPAPVAPPPLVLPPPPPMPVPASQFVAGAPVAAPVAPATTAPSSAPPAPAATTASATTSAARRGVRDGLDANAPPGTSRSYAAKVRSWLLAHKIYPRGARMRREEGLVRVRFVIDRTGRLLEGGVVDGCGRTALDDEAAAMLRRASPYPAAPIDMPGERFEITAPIEFVLPV